MPRKKDNQKPDEIIIKLDDFDQSDSPEPAPALDKADIMKLPRATHAGELKIGDAVLICAVLEDGTRVLTQDAFNRALGRIYAGRTGGVEAVPPFLSAANLEPYISNDLRRSWSPILFRPKSGSRRGYAYGYRAELLPQVCNVYLEAESAGQLHGNQKRIAQQCGILIRGLATVGIVALVDEATGYQEARDRDALHKILEAYIAKELLPWTKRFPDEFYKEMFRLQSWQYSPLTTKGPRYAGRITNEIVYDRLPPGVLDELREKNPVVDGRRKHKHHQFLTENIGNPHLEKHLAIVTALMRASPNWKWFLRTLDRAVPKPGVPTQGEIITDEDLEELNPGTR
jgi:hypothetical protein